MERRGAGQVEIIIAFVLFIGFVLFALYFFSPLRNERLYDSSLEYAMREIIKNASIQIDQRSLAISPDVTAESVAIAVTSFDREGTNFRVLKEDGEEVESWTNDGDLVFELEGEKFFFVQFSEEFANASEGASAVELNSNSFALGTSSIRQLIGENKFLELNSSYYSNYDGLKNQFNLPGRVDFAFGLYFDNKSIEAIGEIPDGLSVSASRQRVEILKLDDSITFGELGVSVW